MSPTYPSTAKSTRRAFTIVELMVAMVLSSIFLAAISSTFILFLKIERSTTAMNEMEYQIRNFRNAFSKDVREAKVFRITSGDKIEIKLLDDTVVTYTQDSSDSSLLRRQYSGSDRVLIRDLKSVSFTFSTTDQEEVLASLSLSRKVRANKDVTTSLKTLYRKRN